jgi:hypothetical protein
MQLLIELPDDIAEELSREEPDLAHQILEGFAIEAYRQGRLTGLQVRRLLHMETRFDLERLLQREHIAHAFTDDEVEQEFQASHRVGLQH